MKLNRKRDLNRSGIYCIRNTINNKVYIGKAKCIYTRMKQHVTFLNTKNKNENRHLINAWHKYGKESFEYFIVEYLPLNEKLIGQRELFWQKHYEAFNPEKGYNMRLDSTTGLIVSEETRKKLSESQILRFKNPEERKKCSHDFWKKNPNVLKQMSAKVRDKISKYFIDQYTKEGEFIKRWKGVYEIISENPNYKIHNIYAVCSGEKPSMYGYKWKKELMLNEDIVQTQLKD